MKNISLFVFLVFMSCCVNANAQDKRPKIADFFMNCCVNAQDKRPPITDFINQEIKIDDGWAGQSITIVKEEKEYFVLRKFYGSGVPITNVLKYAVTFDSKYQIRFSKVIEQSNDFFEGIEGEAFLMCIEGEGISLYLNDLKIVIEK